MKKKILFTAYSLELGGIETSLINLLEKLDYQKYEITLIVEKKEGIFLERVPKYIKVYEYKLHCDRLVMLRKIKNRLKLIYWKNKLRSKYAFSCSFATYSIPGAHLALAASKNSCLWVHNNYHITYPNDNELKKFFDSVFAYKFKNIIFVSEENRKDICEHYDKFRNVNVCNNFINGKEIVKKSLESVSFYKDNNPLFLNVGRHDEKQKKLTRIIKSARKLKDEGYKFSFLFVGDGPDYELYKQMIKDYGLEDTIKLIGKKKNPYPYYRLADAVILSSDYEGYPVVFLESMLLEKPILSTKVSDYQILDGIYGMFCNKTENDVYEMIKNYLDNSFVIKEKFDYNKYNDEIYEKIEHYIND